MATAPDRWSLTIPTGRPQIVALSGSGLGASLSPTSVTFSTQTDGTTSASKTITLTNHTPTAITSISPSLSDTNATDFTITGGTCVGSLAGNSSCTYLITFTPTVAGAETATLNVTDSDGAQSATLKGTGTMVTVTPSSLNFGKVTVGHTTTDKTVTVTNASASTTVTITSIAIGGTNPGDFAIDGTSTCPIAGGSLSPSTSCTVLVNFTPTVTGRRSAKLNVNDNGAGPNSLQTVSLSGTGVWLPGATMMAEV